MARKAGIAGMGNVVTISVIIPAFNSQSFIREALNSVSNQSSPIHEVICVDDASTDHTVSLIRSEFPTVTILQNESNAGPSFTRNRGLSVATGDMIAFLDADDYWLPDSLESLSREFVTDPLLELTAGVTELFFAADHNGGTPGEPHFNAYMSSMLIKRSVFTKIGTFNTDMRLSEDHDWFLRAREAGICMKITDKIVLRKRVHATSTTHQLTFSQSGMMQAIKNSLDRRRSHDDLTDLIPINRSAHD